MTGMRISPLPPTARVTGPERAFTLIELSIVLVIIGLIVGGVLVGQNLISAAAVRAQITQIEKYNTAVNTFRGKYGALPGDMNAATATQFGFTTRGSAGQGDGNGIIQGNNSGTVGGTFQQGETGLFWIDLTSANGLNVNLIDGSFTHTDALSITNAPVTFTSTPETLDAWFPKAKIGQGNFIYVFSGGINGGTDATNYYGLSAVYSMAGGGGTSSNPGLTVQQAYGIDKKVDDGLPQTGNIIAAFINGGVDWWSTYAGTDSATTCFNNSTNAYSLSINGSALNCGISFKFQ